MSMGSRKQVAVPVVRARNHAHAPRVQMGAVLAANVQELAVVPRRAFQWKRDAAGAAHAHRLVHARKDPTGAARVVSVPESVVVPRKKQLVRRK